MKIKRVLGIILSIGLIISLLSGCSFNFGNSPTKTADTFLKALKEKDSETLSTVYEENNLEFLESLSEEGITDSDEASKFLEEQLYAKILDFDYEISNEQIDGDKATVDVKITTYKIGDAFIEFFGQYFTQAFVLAFSGASDEEMTEKMESIMSDTFSKLTEKDFEKTATLSLTKKDDKWIVDKIDDEGDFMDAITGGLISSVKNLEEELENSFSGWDDESLEDGKISVNGSTDVDMENFEPGEGVTILDDEETN